LEEYSVSTIIDDALRLAHDMDVISIVAEDTDGKTISWCYFPGLSEDE